MGCLAILRWDPIVIPLMAAGAFFAMDRFVLGILAILAAAGCLYSWRIMRVYASALTNQRLRERGGKPLIMPSEADAVPNWMAGVHMICAATGLILTIIAIIYLLIEIL